MINTLLENYNKIKSEEYRTDIYMYIIQTSSKIDTSMIINDSFWLFPIKCLKTEHLKEKKYSLLEEKALTVIDRIPIEEIVDKIKFLQQSEVNQKINYYILFAKIVDLFDEKIKAQTIGIDPFRIVTDFLHILSLYFTKYFLTYPNESISLSEECYHDEFGEVIDKGGISRCSLDIQNEIENNLNVICNLRMDQFLFLFKGLSNFNNSLLISENNVSIAFSLMISVVETFASKYSDAKENWDEYKDNSFYVGLKKILQSASLDENHFNELFDQIGNNYIKHTHQSSAKFKDFILKFVSPRFLLLEDPNNSLFKKDLSEYYNLRSKYLHAGKEFPTMDKKSNMIYNLIKSKGKRERKLKKYSEKGYLDLKILFPYNWFSLMTKSCIISFTNYLHHKRDHIKDKERYSEIDTQPRGQVMVTISRPKKPTDLIYDRDIYRKDQYVDLYNRNKFIKKFETEKNYHELIKEYNRILNILENSNDSLKLGIAHNFLGVALSHTGDLDNAIKNAQTSLEIIKKRDDKYLIAEIHYNLACFYCLKNDKKNALDYFKKAIKEENDYSKFLKKLANDDPQLEKCCTDPDFLELLKDI